MDKASLEAAGWESVEVGGFTGLVGPFWRRENEASVELGLIVAEHHCNNHLGTLHGGVVMTFADIALGYGVAKALDEQRYNSVTVSLQTQFIAIARVGDFIACQPELIQRGKQMLFVRGLIKTGEKTVASAEGIWKILN